MQTAMFESVKMIYNRYDPESIPGMNMNFSSSRLDRQSIPWAPGALSVGLKQPRRDADN
jgi:hypothetical protein